ncbi:SDR family oxidoreductase [Desulfocicer niacini]
MPTPKILITGATGYVGRRLKDVLIQENPGDIRLLVRNRKKISPAVRDMVEIVEGDTFNPAVLDTALKGIAVAYYLIHSMGKGADFESQDRTRAVNFRQACIRQGVRRIIYLGGLGAKATASRHLLSRMETGKILSEKEDQVETVWFRAGIIIGAGSASFEIIRNLIQKLPVMITPRWVNTLTQPVGIDDVIAYLVAAVHLEHTGNLMVDIGTDAMNFKEMMIQAAAVMGLKRHLIPVPVLTPSLSSWWLIFFTPIPFAMAAALVEGLKSETILLNRNAEKYFPDIVPMTFEKCVAGAINEMEHDHIISRWCDSSGGNQCDLNGQDLVHGPILWDRRTFSTGNLSRAQLFASVCSLGGDEGWFAYDLLWKLRGAMDKLMGGYGLNRGRRLKGSLRVGDAVDFWKVADIKPGKRLLLLAQMKVPGKAWLEFDIRDDSLVQTAHFYPKGLLGRVYWFVMFPFHMLIFKALGEQILEHAADF